MDAGWKHLEGQLQGLRRSGRIGVIPFLTVGFPNWEATLDLGEALEQAGATALELGVPFSDPLADGLTIQKASFHALKQGVTLELCLQAVAGLRRRGVRIPLVLMGYYNPVLRYGIDRSVHQGLEAGVDG
ncbi:MAG: tryptophan synthase subunit alpha, partial [Chloroflexi bacterium]|nr:tryptophan synthase subunit alpha [Chloroflexota bacterium]